MAPKDAPLGNPAGAARQPAPESRTEGDAFELPGLSGGDPAQAAAVMGTMMEVLQERGGLGGLLDQFRASGLASQADAWSRGDDSQGVSGDQVQQVLGAPIVDLIAQRLGLTPDQARATLAQLVPKITSRMAAEEKLTGQPNPELEQALGMFRKIIG